MVRFLGDPDHCLEPGIFKGIFTIAFVNNIGSVGPYRGYALSDCSCHIYILIISYNSRMGLLQYTSG